MIIKYKKKGNLAKSEEGDLLLVNESKKAYKIDEVIALVWNMCDGSKDESEIIEAFSSQLDVDKKEISNAVSEIIGELEKVGLLEKVE